MALLVWYVAIKPMANYLAILTFITMFLLPTVIAVTGQPDSESIDVELGADLDSLSVGQLKYRLSKSQSLHERSVIQAILLDVIMRESGLDSVVPTDIVKQKRIQ